MFNLEIMYRSVCLSYHVGWLIVTSSTVILGCVYGMLTCALSVVVLVRLQNVDGEDDV